MCVELRTRSVLGETFAKDSRKAPCRDITVLSIEKAQEKDANPKTQKTWSLTWSLTSLSLSPSLSLQFRGPQPGAGDQQRRPSRVVRALSSSTAGGTGEESSCTTGALRGSCPLGAKALGDALRFCACRARMRFLGRLEKGDPIQWQSVWAFGRPWDWQKFEQGRKVCWVEERCLF